MSHWVWMSENISSSSRIVDAIRWQILTASSGPVICSHRQVSVEHRELGAVLSSGDAEVDLPVPWKSRQAEFRVTELGLSCPVDSGYRILEHFDLCLACGSTVKMILEVYL